MSGCQIGTLCLSVVPFFRRPTKSHNSRTLYMLSPEPLHGGLLNARSTDSGDGSRPGDRGGGPPRRRWMGLGGRDRPTWRRSP